MPSDAITTFLPSCLLFIASMARIRRSCCACFSASNIEWGVASRGCMPEAITPAFLYPQPGTNISVRASRALRTICRVLFVGSGNVSLMLPYCCGSSSRKRLVAANTVSSEHRLPSERSFSAVIEANLATCVARVLRSKISCEKLRELHIDCLLRGWCSKPIEGMPCSSRHVRTPLIPIRLRMYSSLSCRKSQAVCMPLRCRRGALRRPMPHTSSIGVLRNTFSISSSRCMKQPPRSLG